MINIQQILAKHSPIIATAYENPDLLSGNINGHFLKAVIKEIIEKVLEEAAKNANTSQYIVDLRTEEYEKEINKQSILDTIYEIEF